MTLRSLLRPGPVTVRVGPLSAVVGAAWADEWLIALEDGHLSNVVPAMLDDGADEVTEGLLACTVTSAHLAAAAKEAITEAAGRPWYEVIRLVQYSAKDGGKLTAALILDGIRPGETTIGLWCAAVVSYVSARLDEMKLMQFEADLRIPPGGSAADVSGFDTVQF